MRPALVGLSALLQHHSSVSYSESRLVNMDMSVCGRGYLQNPPRSYSIVGRRRVTATLSGFLCPLRAGWVKAWRHAAAPDLVPLPEFLLDTGLPVPPAMLLLGEYLYSYLEDTSQVAWTIVSTEMVLDCASVWFQCLREREVLVCVKRNLLKCFPTTFGRPPREVTERVCVGVCPVCGGCPRVPLGPRDVVGGGRGCRE